MADAKVNIGAGISGVDNVVSGLNKIKKELESVARAQQKMQVVAQALGTSVPQTLALPPAKESKQTQRDVKAQMSSVDLTPITKVIDTSIKNMSKAVENKMAQVSNAIDTSPSFKRLVEQAKQFLDYKSFEKSFIKAYHGGPKGFEKFDPAKRGEMTGAPSAKKAFFFAQDREVAETYASKVAQIKWLIQKKEKPGTSEAQQEDIDNQIHAIEDEINAEYFEINQRMEEVWNILHQRVRIAKELKTKWDKLQYDETRDKSVWQGKEVPFTDIIHDEKLPKVKEPVTGMEGWYSKKQQEESGYGFIPDLYTDAGKVKREKLEEELKFLKEHDPALSLGNGLEVKERFLEIEKPLTVDQKGLPRKSLGKSFSGLIDDAKNLGKDALVVKNTLDAFGVEKSFKKITNVFAVFSEEAIHTKEELKKAWEAVHPLKETKKEVEKTEKITNEKEIGPHKKEIEQGAYQPVKERRTQLSMEPSTKIIKAQETAVETIDNNIVKRLINSGKILGALAEFPLKEPLAVPIELSDKLVQMEGFVRGFIDKLDGRIEAEKDKLEALGGTGEVSNPAKSKEIKAIAERIKMFEGLKGYASNVKETAAVGSDLADDFVSLEEMTDEVSSKLIASILELAGYTLKLFLENSEKIVAVTGSSKQIPNSIKDVAVFMRDTINTIENNLGTVVSSAESEIKNNPVMKKGMKKIGEKDILQGMQLSFKEELPKVETDEERKALNVRRAEILKEIVSIEKRNLRAAKKAVKSGDFLSFKEEDTTALKEELYKIVFALMDWRKIIDSQISKLPKELQHLLAGLKVIQGDPRQTRAVAGWSWGATADDVKYPISGVPVRRRSEKEPVISMPLQMKQGIDEKYQKIAMYSTLLHEITHYFGVTKESIQKSLNNEITSLSGLISAIKDSQLNIALGKPSSEYVAKIENILNEISSTDSPLAALAKSYNEDWKEFSKKIQDAESLAFSKGENLPGFIVEELERFKEKTEKDMSAFLKSKTAQLQKLVEAREIADKTLTKVSVPGAKPVKTSYGKIAPDVGKGTIIPTSEMQKEVEKVRLELVKLGVPAEVAGRLISEQFRDTSKAALALLKIIEAINEEEKKSPGFRKDVFSTESDLEALQTIGSLEKIATEQGALTNEEFNKRKKNLFDVAKRYAEVIKLAKKFYDLELKRPGSGEVLSKSIDSRLVLDEESKASVKNFIKEASEQADISESASMFFMRLSPKNAEEAMALLGTVSKIADTKEREAKFEDKSTKRLLERRRLYERVYSLISKNASLQDVLIDSGKTLDEMSYQELKNEEFLIRLLESESKIILGDEKISQSRINAEKTRAEILSRLSDKSIAKQGILSKKSGVTKKEVLSLDLDTELGRSKLATLKSNIDKSIKDIEIEIIPEFKQSQMLRVANNIKNTTQKIPDKYLTAELRLSTEDLSKKFNKKQLDKILLDAKNLFDKLKREGKIDIEAKVSGEAERDLKSIEAFKQKIASMGFDDVYVTDALVKLEGLRGDALERQIKDSILLAKQENKRRKETEKIVHALQAEPVLIDIIKKKTGIAIGKGDLKDGDKLLTQEQKEAELYKNVSVLSDSDLKKIQTAISLHRKMEGAAYRNRLEQDRIARSIQRFGTIVFATFGMLMREAVKFNLALVELTSAYNLTNSEAMQLAGLAETTGVSIDKLVIGIGNYYQKILTAGMGTSLVAERVREALTRVGISTVRLGEYGMGAVDMLNQMRRAFQELKSPQDKAYLGNMVFGGQFKEFLPLLEMGDEAFARITERFKTFSSLTGEQLRQSVIDANAEIRAMVFSFRFLGQQLVTSLGPQIGAIADKFESLVQVIQALPRPVTTFGVQAVALIALLSLLFGSILRLDSLLGRTAEYFMRASAGGQVFSAVMLKIQALMASAMPYLLIASAIAAIGYATWKTIKENKEYNKTLQDIEGRYKRLEGIRGEYVSSLVQEKKATKNLTARDKEYLKQADDNLNKIKELEKRREILSKSLKKKFVIPEVQTLKNIEDETKPFLNFWQRFLVSVKPLPSSMFGFGLLIYPFKFLATRDALRKINNEMGSITKRIPELLSSSLASAQQVAQDKGGMTVAIMAQQFNAFERIMANSTVNVRDKISQMEKAFNEWADFNADHGVSIEQETKKYAEEISKILDGILADSRKLNEELKQPWEGPNASEYIKSLSALRKGSIAQLKLESIGHAAWVNERKKLIEKQKELIPLSSENADVGRKMLFADFQERIPKLTEGTVEALLNAQQYIREQMIKTLVDTTGLKGNEAKDLQQEFLNAIQKYANSLKEVEKQKQLLSVSEKELAEKTVMYEENKANLIERIERELAYLIRNTDYETFKIRSDIRKSFIDDVKEFASEIRTIESGLGFLPDFQIGLAINSESLRRRKADLQREIRNLVNSTSEYVKEEKLKLQKDLNEGEISISLFNEKLMALEAKAYEQERAKKSQLETELRRTTYQESLALLKEYSDNSAMTHKERINTLASLLDFERIALKQGNITNEEYARYEAINLGKQLAISKEYTNSMIETQNELLVARSKFNKEHYNVFNISSIQGIYRNILALEKSYAQEGKDLTLEQQKSLISELDKNYNALLSVETLSNAERLKILSDYVYKVKNLDKAMLGEKSFVLSQMYKILTEYSKIGKELIFKSPFNALRDSFNNFLTNTKDQLRDIKLKIFDNMAGMIDRFTETISSKPGEIGKSVSDIFESISQSLIAEEMSETAKQLAVKLMKTEGLDYTQAIGKAMRLVTENQGDYQSKKIGYQMDMFDSFLGDVSEEEEKQYGQVSKKVSKNLGYGLNIPRAVLFDADVSLLTLKVENEIKRIKEWLLMPENQIKAVIEVDASKLDKWFSDTRGFTTGIAGTAISPSQVTNTYNFTTTINAAKGEDVRKLGQEYVGELQKFRNNEGD